MHPSLKRLLYPKRGTGDDAPGKIPSFRKVRIKSTSSGCSSANLSRQDLGSVCGAVVGETPGRAGDPYTG